MELVFWLSLAAALYAYFGYPFILLSLAFLLGKTSKQPSGETKQLPRLTLVISAYNEEGAIEQKIKNSLELTYPRGLLEILVASDGSTDSTSQIVMKYADQGVVLKHYEDRIGKSACLNHTVGAAKGEIVVFSDANSQYDRNALTELVKHFADKDIGFVTGHTKYMKSDDGGMVESIGLYSRIERFTKQIESRFFSCVGADGAIFAIRKCLYRPLHPDDINDLVTPLAVVRNGYRGVIEAQAFCSEGLSAGYSEEFRRQVRIASRTIRAVVSNADLLNPVRYGLFSFELLSHKVGKLTAPFFLALLFFSNALLIPTHSIYLGFFVGQVLLYLSPVEANLLRGDSAVSKVISVARTFVLYNSAIVVGWLNYIRGKKYTTWTTIRH